MVAEESVLAVVLRQHSCMFSERNEDNSKKTQTNRCLNRDSNGLSFKWKAEVSPIRKTCCWRDSLYINVPWWGVSTDTFPRKLKKNVEKYEYKWKHSSKCGCRMLPVTIYAQYLAIFNYACICERTYRTRKIIMKILANIQVPFPYRAYACVCVCVDRLCGLLVRVYSYK